MFSSPKQHLLRLTRSFRSGRSVELPADEEQASRVLLSMIFANQHKSMADLLSNSTYNVNFIFGRAGRTLLHIAANCGQFESLSLFLRKGCDPNIQDITGITALHLAARNGHTRCVDKLLEYKADPDIQGKDGSTALHWLAISGRSEIMDSVLQHTIKVNLEDIQGHTPLHAASRNGHEQAIRCLFKVGADINHANKSGVSPLHSASVNGQRQAIQTLLELGANFKADNSGTTPLDLCFMGGYGIAAELLFQYFPENLNPSITKCIYVDLNISKVKDCLSHFATQPLGISIAEKLTHEINDIGFQLLSLSTDKNDLITALKRCIDVLSALCNDKMRKICTESECFNNLEPLWKSMDDWFFLFKNGGTKNEDIQKNKENENQELLEKMAERLSALVNAFYHCITWQDGTVDIPQRFTDFILINTTTLCRIIQFMPQVIFKHFSFLWGNKKMMAPFLGAIWGLPFLDRFNWFYEQLLAEISPTHQIENHTLTVDRNNLFEESCKGMEHLSTNSLKENISVQFKGEEGMGDGVLREWFGILSNEILNPEYGLFTQSTDGCTFQPSSFSAINPDHLSYFKFAGRILGLALYHHQLVNVRFTLSFYKHLLGVKLDYRDMTSIDPEYAKNLQWMLDNDITDLGLELSFVVETDVFGAMMEIELKSGGANIPVTEANKEEYVQLVTELRMTRAIEPQIKSFMEGFNQFIPSGLIQIFSASELDLMLSGESEIDINHWQFVTKYTGAYSSEHQVIEWFWKCVSEMDFSDQTSLLHFVTGRTRLPTAAIAKATSYHFVVSHDTTKNFEQLPTASTCMNMLLLPEYKEYEILKDKITTAIRYGSHGYTRT